MTVINASGINPGQERLFPVRRLSDDTPCIVGSATEKASSNDNSLFVFSSEGERTKTHPLPEADKCLYEIHTGDFVGVYEVDSSKEIMLISSYYISRITQEIAVGIPAIL